MDDEARDRLGRSVFMEIICTHDFDGAVCGTCWHSTQRICRTLTSPTGMLGEATEALDAAQDEIEARILASERDRELIRQLGVVVDHMAPAAYKAIMAGGGVV